MKTEKYYTVNWYSNDFCYRTTVHVPGSRVKELRQIAKMLGETIKTELER